MSSLTRAADKNVNQLVNHLFYTNIYESKTLKQCGKRAIVKMALLDERVRKMRELTYPHLNRHH